MSLPEQIDELCDAWADQWQLDSCPDLQQFLAETDPELLNAALSILIPMDFNLRRSKRPDLEASDYNWLGDDAVAIAERCCVRSVVPDSSGAGLKADSAGGNGLWRFQSECDEPNADGRQDDAHTPRQSDFPTQVGEYRIVELIGGGGQGIVAKAVHQKSGLVAAIKFIRPELAASLPVRRRFLREATIARSIRHPNVVQFLSVEEQPQLCFVMEFVTGKTLETYIRELGTLTLQQLLTIGIQVAEGLEAVHSANIVHRDLKPLNILLETNVSMVARISDFGVARFSGDPGITRCGTIVGSAAWLSPEQALEKPASERSDLFSLGSILYCMACGQSPFLRSTLMGTLNAIVQDNPVRVSSIRCEFPEDFCKLLDALLDKNPEARPDSAAAVSASLRAIAGMLNVVPSVGESSGIVEAVTTETPRRIGRRTLLATTGIVAGAIAARRCQSLLLGESDDSPRSTSFNRPARTIPSLSTPTVLDVPFADTEARLQQKIWAKHLRLPIEFDVSDGVRFTLIPPIRPSSKHQLKIREELQRFASRAENSWPESSLTDTKGRYLPFFAATRPLTWRQYRVLCDGQLAGSLLARLSRHDHNARSAADDAAEITWREALEIRLKLGQHASLGEKLPGRRSPLANYLIPEVGLPTPIEWFILAAILQVESPKEITSSNLVPQIQMVSESGLVSGTNCVLSAAGEKGIFSLWRVTSPIYGWVDAVPQNNGVVGKLQPVVGSPDVDCSWQEPPTVGEDPVAMCWPVIRISSLSTH